MEVGPERIGFFVFVMFLPFLVLENMHNKEKSLNFCYIEGLVGWRIRVIMM
ncbi:hypothetical protein PPE_05205 [Paenibacillus polymyxa E681]|nr:hypothetical protein PPE_05205 [Paenibacillus polymyxa E681]